MSIVTARRGNLYRYQRDHLRMRTRTTRRTCVGLLAAVLIAGLLSACADSGDDQDDGGDSGEVGVVSDQEFLGHRLREGSRRAGADGGAGCPA